MEGDCYCSRVFCCHVWWFVAYLASVYAFSEASAYCAGVLRGEGGFFCVLYSSYCYGRGWSLLGVFSLLGWRERNVGVEGEVAYFYFVCKVHNSASEGRRVILEMLGLGVAWVIIEGVGGGG